MLRQTISRTVLDNGITVLSDLMPGTYSAMVGAWIPRGSRHETEEINGLSHFYEHLVFKGTEKRSSLEIAHLLEDRGGNLEAYTTRQETGFYAQVIREDLPLAVDVIADMLMSPRFDEKEMEKSAKSSLKKFTAMMTLPKNASGICSTKSIIAVAGFRFRLRAR